MEKNGSMGKWMMRNTASIQVSFDIISEEDMEEMAFVADCLHPIAAYLFANSPYQNGKATELKNIRNIIWENTDQHRCRSLFDHTIETPNGLVDRYIEYILKVQSIFKLDLQGEVESSDKRLGEVLQNLYDKKCLKDKDIQSALHQIFTNVRLKRLVEVRGADRTPRGYEMAPVAFWTGLLMENNARIEAHKVLMTWNKNDRKLFNKAVDVHMSDLFTGVDSLSGYQGIVACGGFSYGDVLGAGGGWAKSILYNSKLSDEFSLFFGRSDTFSLGICNGCQMMSHLKNIIPGAENWPNFKRNKSEQFEARFSLVEIQKTNSIFLDGMSGSKLPIATSHGEGRAVFENEDCKQRAEDQIALRYIDNHGNIAERYPDNPNGSVDGICGLSSSDGRATIIMPHPERVSRTTQNSWHPEEWGEEGPWFYMFKNARRYLG